MAIKTFKPYTPARRNMTVSAFDGVDKKAKPERSLVETLKKNAGRNSYGHITVRHRGGGNKRKYRVIGFKRLKTDMSATATACPSPTSPSVPLSTTWSCSPATALSWFVPPVPPRS